MWTLVKLTKTMLKFSAGLYIIFLFVTISFNSLFANETHEAAGTDTLAENGFNAGKFIIEHVSDSYDWHIVSFGETHISIPLPVILYSKKPELHEGKSLHVFMSSKFHHGHEAFKGFRISHSKEFEGKIVELDATGTEIRKTFGFFCYQSCG